MTQIYQDQVGQVNTTADIIFVQGACVGGSTVIGACVMEEPGDEVLDGWASQYGLENLPRKSSGPIWMAWPISCRSISTRPTRSMPVPTR